MKRESLKPKKRGEDGSRVITARIREDKLAAEVDYSRNELITFCCSTASRILK